MALGINGAALAALGEMPADFFAAVFAPLGERKEGVKLGESTFRVFFDWLNEHQHTISAPVVQGLGIPVILSTIGCSLFYIVIERAA